MKKIAILFLLFIGFIFNLTAQKDFNKHVNIEKYKEENERLKIEKITPNDHRIVLIGNSITEGWVRHRHDFFIENNCMSSN